MALGRTLTTAEAFADFRLKKAPILQPAHGTSHRAFWPPKCRARGGANAPVLLGPATLRKPVAGWQKSGPSSPESRMLCCRQVRAELAMS